eukprot:UN11003
MALYHCQPWSSFPQAVSSNVIMYSGNGIRFVLTTDNMQLTISRLKTTQNNSTHTTQHSVISVSVQTTTINHRYVQATVTAAMMHI